MPHPDIRPLSATDLEAVIAIDKAITGISRRGYFEKRLGSATDRPREHVYVGLQCGGQLRGYALAKMVGGAFGKPGASAALDSIGVHPEHDRKGYGQMLLDGVQSVLAGKGVANLTSQVDWSNAAMLGFFNRAGFAMAPRLVLHATPADIANRLPDELEPQVGAELDFSAPDSDDFTALSHDRIPVRSMRQGDLGKIISIDKAGTGTDRRDYYTRLLHESLHQSGVRLSLVAELEGYPVGFIMARVDFGEFGQTGAEAVMDSIGVDPGYHGQGVGQALMSQLFANLGVLRVETLRTEIDWNSTDLIAYFDAVGFVPAQRITLVRQLG